MENKEKEPRRKEHFAIEFDLSREALKNLIIDASYHHCSLNDALNRLLTRSRLVPSLKLGDRVGRALEEHERFLDDVEKYIDSLQK